MGNRAVITTAPFDENNIGIYVHWNGGRESIEGFLNACFDLGYRDPVGDPSYALARLTQAIGVFFGGSTSVGVNVCSKLDCDNGDNGTYLIGAGWKIVGREFAQPDWDTSDPEKSAAIAKDIVEKIRQIDPEARR